MEEDQVENDRSLGTEDKKWQDEGPEASKLQINMQTATNQLQFDLKEAESNLDKPSTLSLDSKEDSKFQENDMIVRSHDLELSLDKYKINAQEVLSGEFNATHTKKYVNPTTFRHTL